MTVLKVLGPLVFLFLLTAATPTPSPSPVPSPTPTPAASPTPSPSPSPQPSPSPVPTPTPVNAFITLDVTAGGFNTQISVSGNSFLPGEQMSIYWDTTGKVIGSTTADSKGNFANVHVKPFAGDPSGLHHICASVPPFPCAQFELTATPTPTPTPPPSPTPSGSPSPSDSATPSDSPSPTPVVVTSASNNGIDVLMRPPFIFLPIIAALGILGALAYWAFSTVSRRPKVLPSASIVHRSARPVYGPLGAGSTPPPPATPAAGPTAAVPPPPPPADLPPPPPPADIAPPPPWPTLNPEETSEPPQTES